MKTEYDLIRIGSDFDGGYLLPDDLQNLEASFSPGVNEEIGFDLEISNICNRCYLADASVDEPAGLTPNMNFLKKFIGISPWMKKIKNSIISNYHYQANPIDVDTENKLVNLFKKEVINLSNIGVDTSMWNKKFLNK